MRERERPDKKTKPDRALDRNKLADAMGGEPAPIDLRAFAVRAGRIIARAARKAHKSLRRHSRSIGKIANRNRLP